MARRIAFLNYKGGVGKTSLIVNIATCLAQQGARVLLCDLDTQSNASIWLLRLERWNRLVSGSGGTVFTLFQPNPPKLAELIVRDVVEDREGKKFCPGSTCSRPVSTSSIWRPTTPAPPANPPTSTFARSSP
jgi:chromosome partitioning protein